MIDMDKYPDSDMSGFSPESTNLHCYVYLIHNHGGEPRAPFLQVKLDGGFKSICDSACVSLEEAPRKIDGDLEIPSSVWNELVDWIRLNKTILIEYWESEDLMTDELFERLEMLP